MLAGALAPVARAALVDGESALKRFIIQLGQPVQPMLAQSADSVDEALDALGEVSLEYKMDGARIQVHKTGDDVRVYSRNLREVTGAVPEVVEIVRRAAARELILDGEVIALRADGTPWPFQVTMRRFGRKNWMSPRSSRSCHLLPFSSTRCISTGSRSSTSRSCTERWHSSKPYRESGPCPG